MYPGDVRSRWRADLLSDRRVRHWWDERRLVAKQLTTDIGPFEALRARGSRVFKDDLLWDAYVLFDRGARWRQEMPRPVSWGYTILAAKDALATDVKRLLDTSR